ncbi:putative secreted protein [Wickerhamomyces ciferrii]|uniref:Secreted protein n=1 Tax=Wickerhamomyces ciferrii (strain ATCC 14091 / BCRC 22168 / CBS 111 / JCM 3599 / NBRC 0793 / NRRL Y-1031 F-60-10) TaxID=1206466 RepID=K0KJK2_WICCF|nr:uncharacterized protein BN7_1841 [Wickerhamomyces ciferrii]CCH42297.1 putative secreted protein [Wickerhamomyces ciferrii]
MFNKLLFFCISSLVIAIYWQYPQNETNPEVITTPYQDLPITVKAKLDQLQPGYDPRRFGLEILNYLQESSEPIPFDWNDVIDRGNKTGLGIYYMDKFNIEQIVLLHKQIHQFSTKEGIEDQLPRLDDENVSISNTISGFFANEEQLEIEYDYHYLNSTDFKFKLSPPLTGNSTKFRYFKEASLLQEPNLAHYDLRFYKGRLSSIDRISILHRIIRSWFSFTNQLKLNTWIAHGSLLGYYFNGLMLPWDDDLDVQITAKSFEKLLQCNQSMVIDYNDEINLGKYIIDINPWYGVRNKESDNKIDARFIDVESGLYIDITTLSIDQIKLENFDNDKDGLIEMYKVFNSNFDYSTMTQIEKAIEEIELDFNVSSENQDLVFCKDYHIYKIDELNPLIPTNFEGSIGYVPNQIQDLLLREYKRKSLYQFEYKTYIFDKFQRIWKHSFQQYEINSQMMNFIKHHESIRQGIIKRSEFFKSDLIEFPSFRVEPWLRTFILQNIN